MKSVGLILSCGNASLLRSMRSESINLHMTLSNQFIIACRNRIASQTSLAACAPSNLLNRSRAATQVHVSIWHRLDTCKPSVSSSGHHSPRLGRNKLPTPESVPAEPSEVPYARQLKKHFTPHETTASFFLPSLYPCSPPSPP